MRRVGRLLWLLLLGTSAASAHPLAPALLQIEAVDAQDYALHWRRSPQSFAGLERWPELPASCEPRGEVRTQVDALAAVDSRWRVHCPFSDWSGQRLAFSGLQGSGVEVIVRVRQHDGRRIDALLSSGDEQLQLPAARAEPPVLLAYLRLGLSHLLSGWDHLLFIAGLVLLLRQPRALLITATAFTVGHSLTLSLAALQLLRVPPALAELGIALSILLLAVALLRGPQAKGLWQRRPWWLAAGFGLLHGLGFAGALQEIGLPQDALLPALLGFNLGIECGQLLLIVVMLAVLALGARLPWRLPSLRWLPAYLIGGVAASACWSRLLDLL